MLSYRLYRNKIKLCTVISTNKILFYMGSMKFYHCTNIMVGMISTHRFPGKHPWHLQTFQILSHLQCRHLLQSVNWSRTVYFIWVYTGDSPSATVMQYRSWLDMIHSTWTNCWHGKLSDVFLFVRIYFFIMRQ